MPKKKAKSKPETQDAPSTFGGRRPSSCSAQVDLPARLLRLVVQVEDTQENRKALLAVRETATSRSWTAGHSVVKLEHVIVVGCDELNAPALAQSGGEKTSTKEKTNESESTR